MGCRCCDGRQLVPDYNDLAGTDKTPRNFAIVAFSTPMGPLTGHLVNPNGGFAFGMKWFLILCPILALAVSPFLFLRREVGRTTHIVAWTGYVIGVGFWFFTSVVSVGMSLNSLGALSEFVSGQNT